MRALAPAQQPNWSSYAPCPLYFALYAAAELELATATATKNAAESKLRAVNERVATLEQNIIWLGVIHAIARSPKRLRGEKVVLLESFTNCKKLEMCKN